MPARIRARPRRHNPAPASESLQGLGDRIRKARVEAGISQAQLGAPHFTRAFVSALELGKVRPAMASLEFLAGKLGKPVTFFVEDTERERQRQERELSIVRANQLISQGAARQAIQEITAIPLDGLTVSDRSAAKRVLGRAHLETGDGRSATMLLTEALEGYRSLRDAEQMARTQLLLGRSFVQQLNYGEAEGHLESALKAAITGVIRDSVFKVHALYNLGVVHYGRGHYERALEHFDRAATEGGDIGDPKWLASVYAATGMSRRQVKDYEGAIADFLRSEALFEQLRNRGRVAAIRFETGRTLRAIGNKSRATEVLTAAAQAATEAGDESLAIRIESFVASALAEDGDPHRARSRLESLIARSDSSSDLLAIYAVRITLARLLTTTDAAAAERLLRELVDILVKGGARDDLAETYDQLSKVLASQGRSQEALRYAQLAYSTSLDGRGVGK